MVCQAVGSARAGLRKTKFLRLLYRVRHSGYVVELIA